MVVIRFQRRGTKKVFHHRIVVTEQNRAQSGRVLEVLGFYDPAKKPAAFSLDEPRFVHWVQNGAQVSEAVYRLTKYFKKATAAKN